MRITTMFKFNLLRPTTQRFFSTSLNVLERLKRRTLIRVNGPEVSNFLQGLITNDIEHLNSGPGSMYAMFLNNMGRVLYDTIIYKLDPINTFFIECDSEISEPLQKHLRLHRVRRKIDIVNVGSDFEVHALFSLDKLQGINTEITVNFLKLYETLSQEKRDENSDFLIFRDPRVVDLGFRIITKTNVNILKRLTECANMPIEIKSTKNYRWLRYNIGVGEGIDDLPPGQCFPLENNCDYLHGISFHKGCYIGQELTARIFHTGVVRKRLMPIQLLETPSKMPDEKIVDDNINLGKLRGIENDAGLGLLRITKALSLSSFKVGDGVGKTFKPNWWPNEAPKEKASVSKL